MQNTLFRVRYVLMIIKLVIIVIKVRKKWITGVEKRINSFFNFSRALNLGRYSILSSKLIKFFSGFFQAQFFFFWTCCGDAMGV